jgi:hypothetical protein
MAETARPGASHAAGGHVYVSPSSYLSFGEHTFTRDESTMSEHMKFTPAERLILSNQYLIMEHLKAGGETDTWRMCREIVERGYEYEYEDFSNSIYTDTETMSVEESKEVYQILDMYWILERSYLEHQDRLHDVEPNQYCPVEMSAKLCIQWLHNKL